MFITFNDIMRSRPETFQNTTLVTLGASAQAIGTGFSLYQSAAKLSGRVLNGQAQQAQSGQAATTFGQGQEILTAINQTAATVNSTSQVMTAAKQRLTGLVTAARGEGFTVEMATGTVIPTNAMFDSTRAAYYVARAKMYNGQIQTVVFQVNAHDLTVKASLAKTALDLVNFVMDSTGSGAQQTPASGSTAAPLPTGGLPSTSTGSSSTPTPGLAADASRPGFGLASAGTLGLDATAGGRAGLGPLGAGTLTGGAAGLGAQALAGAGPGGPGGPVAVGRAGGAGSFVGLGGAGMGAVGHAEEEPRSTAWKQLTEDEDVFGAGDLPDTNDGVLA